MPCTHGGILQACFAVVSAGVLRTYSMVSLFLSSRRSCLLGPSPALWQLFVAGSPMCLFIMESSDIVFFIVVCWLCPWQRGWCAAGRCVLCTLTLYLLLLGRSVYKADVAGGGSVGTVGQRCLPVKPESILREGDGIKWFDFVLIPRRVCVCTTT